MDDITRPEEGYYLQFSGKVYLTEPQEFKKGIDYIFVIKASCRGLNDKLNREEEVEKVTSMKIWEAKLAP